MSTGDLIRAAVQNAGYKEDIVNVLCNLNEYMKRKQWWDACHASCSALYVALSELGYSPKLCIGEMLGQGLYFDHSWIELDGQILDIAIRLFWEAHQSLSRLCSERISEVVRSL